MTWRLSCRCKVVPKLTEMVTAVTMLLIMGVLTPQCVFSIDSSLYEWLPKGADMHAKRPCGSLLHWLSVLMLVAGLAAARSAVATSSSRDGSARFSSGPITSGRYWAGGFNQPGFDNGVTTMTAGGADDIYLGGAFRHAFGVAADRIVRWDGAVSAPLGNGLSGWARHGGC